MNVMLKQVVRKKLVNITSKELIDQAKSYQVELTQTQANKIVDMLSRSELDPFRKKDLAEMINYLSKITDQETVKKAKIILNQFIKQYNVADWFY